MSRDASDAEHRLTLDAVLSRRSELGSAAKVAREIGVSAAHLSNLVTRGDRRASGGRVLRWVLDRYFGGSHDAFAAAAPLGWDAWRSRGARHVPELPPAPAPAVSLPPPSSHIADWARELAEVLSEQGHDSVSVRDVIARLILERGQHHESPIRFAARATDMLAIMANMRESAVVSAPPAPKLPARRG
jgi:hypothetical protein